ncbi:MAG: hypothetical protein OEN01_09915 [Candidatus Krumholzibacteria bacterium]|nr:hypothetical protein [Candidatus Krumholzibacteria bacterium]
MYRTRKALLASLLISLTVALGLALSGVPNVEVMTITVFVSGYLLGWRLGFVVGATSITVHSLINPLGASLPPLLLSQIVGFSIVGVAGATIGPWVAKLQRRWVALLACGAMGFILTLSYDVLTNIGAFFSITGPQASASFVQFVIAGMLFMAMHIVWNTSLFLVVLKPVLTVITRYRLDLY